MITTRSTLALFVALAIAAPSYAQQQPDSTRVPASGPDKPVVAKPAPVITTPPLEIQHLRAPDKRGLNVFESPKQDTTQYQGFKFSIGGSFSQDFQGLEHQNRADPKLVNGVDQNILMKVGHGFNNAVANLNLNAQLAPGIRVAMTSYLSARHHQESWVKDGYLLVDDSPINWAPAKKAFQYLTIRAGHFEINYGDAHFRRSDNGNGMFNPLVGNYIMDAFTTEIGTEAYFRKGSLLAMGGMTGGEVHGQVTSPEKRSASYLGKLGFDKTFAKRDLRVRLTASTYIAPKSASNTLYTGDRGGSRYYDILENAVSTEQAAAWSGQIRPGFSNEARAFVVNPFVKFRGVEFFGNIEQSKGRASTEARARVWHQNVGELTYRFLADEKLYVTARYNQASGTLVGIAAPVGVQRSQIGGGWFLTPNVLLKGEWVSQLYKDFPTTDIRSGGKFKGFMMEGVVSF